MLNDEHVPETIPREADVPMILFLREKKKSAGTRSLNRWFKNTREVYRGWDGTGKILVPTQLRNTNL